MSALPPKAVIAPIYSRYSMISSAVASSVCGIVSPAPFPAALVCRGLATKRAFSAAMPLSLSGFERASPTAVFIDIVFDDLARTECGQTRPLNLRNVVRRHPVRPCRLCLQLMVSLHWQSHELHPGCPSTRDMLVFHHRAAHV